MAELKLKSVTRTQGNNQALKDGTVKPRTFTFDFLEVDPLIDAFRRMVRGAKPKQELPPPLPPERRTVGQIVAESIRLYGQSEQQIDVRVQEIQVIPAGQSILPSAALGWLGGGEMPVAQNDPEGRKASEPFFEVRARVQEPETVRFLHGRSGKIRFKMEPAPLLEQWIRRLRQLLQKRYQL